MQLALRGSHALIADGSAGFGGVKIYLSRDDKLDDGDKVVPYEHPATLKTHVLGNNIVELLGSSGNELVLLHFILLFHQFKQGSLKHLQSQICRLLYITPFVNPFATMRNYSQHVFMHASAWKATLVNIIRMYSSRASFSFWKHQNISQY